MRLNTRAILGLAGLSLALAEHHHHHRRVHDQAHANNLAARSLSLAGKTVTITDNTRTQSTSLPEIVVFVDKNGTPVTTAEAVVVLVPPTSSASAAGLAAQFGLPATPSVASPPKGSGSPAVNATGAGLFGVAYAPYNADGSCKSATQIMRDFGVIGQTYGFVRVYGIDCNQIPNVYAAAKASKLKIFFGIFSLDNLGDQIATLVQGIQKDWSIVDTVSIGNELVNNGQASPQQILNALKSGKALLQQSGWTGPVVTVDTFVAVLAHPELCQASDYCACNIHPFFDPNTAPGQAGVFVANQVQNIRNKLGNPSARVRVTESGWPWQGSANGQAVPGVDQQAAAISSIRAAFASNPQDMVLFSAFNDMWKAAAPPTFYAEQYWGIGTANAPSA
ncbi:Cell surface mannoprotein mp65 [Diaporthe australafricana]|uniref:Cell surface mannoprotein mp65 n=1 Tax=Diaporthe australafricana TaxID=127596 RepID=A0ABR3WHR8_9PEZI